MGQYARNTSVSPEKSRGEIERTLQRYGCHAFGYAWEGNAAMIAFKAHDKQVRFILPMPDPDDDEFALTPTGMVRSPSAREKEYEQAIRQKWRALALAIKAKLEAVESGIVSFEDEFLAHFVLPSGQTVGEYLGPQVAELSTKGLPQLMPGASS